MKQAEASPGEADTDYLLEGLGPFRPSHPRKDRSSLLRVSWLASLHHNPNHTPAKHRSAHGQGGRHKDDSVGHHGLGISTGSCVQREPTPHAMNFMKAPALLLDFTKVSSAGPMPHSCKRCLMIKDSPERVSAPKAFQRV